MHPQHINPLQWNQSSGYARQICARIFRDGGSPADAMRAFGLEVGADDGRDWSRAVTAIAEALCAAPLRKAA